MPTLAAAAGNLVGNRNGVLKSADGFSHGIADYSNFFKMRKLLISGLLCPILEAPVFKIQYERINGIHPACFAPLTYDQHQAL